MNIADDAETEDEVITNGKDLYKRFEDLIAKDHIRIGNNSTLGNSNKNNARRND